MIQERLFERISSRDRSPGKRSGPETGKLIDSVSGHLERLFMTKQGCTRIDPGLGMQDAGTFVSEYPKTLGRLEESIRRMVQKFEPRMRSVRVELAEQDDRSHTLHFQIAGVLACGDEDVPVVLKSRLTPDGNMQVGR